MARSNKLPKRLVQLAKLNADKVQSLDVEHDEWGGWRSPYSYWLWLNPGWSPDGEVHCIHEPSVNEFMKVWRQVRRCECEQCKEAMR